MRAHTYLSSYTRSRRRHARHVDTHSNAQFRTKLSFRTKWSTRTATRAECVVNWNFYYTRLFWNFFSPPPHRHTRSVDTHNNASLRHHKNTLPQPNSELGQVFGLYCRHWNARYQDSGTFFFLDRDGTNCVHGSFFKYMCPHTASYLSAYSESAMRRRACGCSGFFQLLSEVGYFRTTICVRMLLHVCACILLHVCAHILTLRQDAGRGWWRFFQLLSQVEYSNGFRGAPGCLGDVYFCDGKLIDYYRGVWGHTYNIRAARGCLGNVYFCDGKLIDILLYVSYYYICVEDLCMFWKIYIFAMENCLTFTFVVEDPCFV